MHAMPRNTANPPHRLSNIHPSVHLLCQLVHACNGAVEVVELIRSPMCADLDSTLHLLGHSLVDSCWLEAGVVVWVGLIAEIFRNCQATNQDRD